jgi:hypothetical protein
MVEELVSLFLSFTQTRTPTNFSLSSSWWPWYIWSCSCFRGSWITYGACKCTFIERKWSRFLFFQACFPSLHLVLCFCRWD